MVFKIIRKNIKKKKTYVQMAKYITHEKTIKMVDVYFKELNCEEISSEIILESYLIRYQSDCILDSSELDKDLLEEIFKLHKILEDNSYPIKKLKEDMLRYSDLYNDWFKLDEDRIISKMVDDYNKFEKQKQNLSKDDEEYISIKLSQKEIKNHLYSIGGEEILSRLDGEINYIDEINDMMKNLEKNYCKLIRDSIIKGDMDIIKRALNDIRGLLLALCENNEVKKNEIVDNLYIDYLSDEEIYSYLLKVISYTKELGDEEIRIKIKDTERVLKFNVIKDKEMSEFLPETLDEIYCHIESLVVKKKIDLQKLDNINYFMDLIKGIK